MALIRSSGKSSIGTQMFIGVTGIEYTMNGTSMGQTYVTFEAGAKDVKLKTSAGGSIYFVDSSNQIVEQQHGTAANTEITVNLTSQPTACKFFAGNNTLSEFIVEY